MNIDIQVDDIANIILSYALSLDFAFIDNPNYSNVYFSDYNSNISNKKILINSNSSKSALISPSITCQITTKF